MSSSSNSQTQGHTSESQGNMFGSQLKRQKNQVRNFSFGNHVTVPSLKASMIAPLPIDKTNMNIQSFRQRCASVWSLKLAMAVCILSRSVD
ncbi:hypothetical protein BDR03DRAFT_1018891 [Suillus americanus]|nr:hypothetical protein BDR03DRAFT_1018891 [Suillus americanus]